MSETMTFSREEYLRRMQQVETALERAGFEALIAYSVKNQPGPVAYLAGYEPGLGLHDVAFLVVVPNGDPRYTFLTNAFWDNLPESTWVDDVLMTGDFAAKLIERLPSSVRRIGIAGYRFFPTPVYLALQAALPEVRFEDATPLLMDIAKIKSQAEIEVIRRCVTVTDAGGRAFLAGIRAGASERELHVEVEQAVRLAGADGFSYSTQIYSGERVAVCVGFSSDRILARGDQVQLDCGVLYQGYRSDFSRTTTVGPPAREVRAIMEATAEMYEVMLRTIRPGVPAADVAQAGIAVAKAQGMESYLFYSPTHATIFMGHGIGCWYHELPVIHPDEKRILETNMVVVLEPILGQPGVGGAKIEDPVLVTSEGAERLSGLEIRPWLE